MSGPGEPATFSCRSARSLSLVLGIGVVIVVEAVALHAWLRARHPAVDWTLTALSLASLVVLALDYWQMGRGRIAVGGGMLQLDIGLRVKAALAVDDVVDATRPTWRDLPTPGTPDAAGYRNLTKPAEPNVLLLMREPVSLRLAGGLSLPARRIGLCVDEPDRFIAALDARTST